VRVNGASDRVESIEAMETPVTVECLGCGERRRVDEDNPTAHLGAGECPRCGYVGWAQPSDLSELVRRSLREFPPERRRLRPV
jgi:Zn ribbon nucleic-acid-binding protein